jgi:hypothetical protein
LYSRLRIFSTDIVLAWRHCSVSMKKIRVLSRITSLRLWNYRYFVNKVFPSVVGNYNDWIQWDIQAFNVSEPYLTYNACACCLKLNKSFHASKFLFIHFSNEALRHSGFKIEEIARSFGKQTHEHGKKGFRVVFYT